MSLEAELLPSSSDTFWDWIERVRLAFDAPGPMGDGLSPDSTIDELGLDSLDIVELACALATNGSPAVHDTVVRAGSLGDLFEALPRR